MESTPVNWDALDSLVIDFAKSENLIEDPMSCSPSPSSPPSSSSYQSRLIVRRVRRSLEIGNIDSALDLLRAHAPFILDDRRFLFRLQKQKFIELLRRGTAENRESAIDCLRTALAPCALDAYPEAYEEFKHVILALIYDKDDQNSPVVNEWSEKRRIDIAGLMSSVLRAYLQAYDPIFSMALRYLISIHKGFCIRQGVVSPISDLTERLLLEERDPPVAPQESLYEAPPFDEVDIQALAHAVELTRQGAVDSLRVAKGDLSQAFQNELCRMRLDVSALDELVREYCVYRGIIDSGLKSIPEPGHCLSRNCSTEMECRTNKHLEGNTSSTADVEVRCPCETMGNYEDCSTSNMHQLGNSRDLQRSRSQGTGERNRRKRWRGRQDISEPVPNTSYSQSHQQDLQSTSLASNTSMLVEQPTTEKRSCLEAIKNGEDKYEIVLGMKELACRGMAAEVVEEVNTLDPNFFTQNPVLLFQLKQVEFLKLVSSGDHGSALKVACSHLGPLAAKDPDLLKPLKETLLTLLRPNEDAIEKGLPLEALASSLQVTMGQRIGIKEPQLMKIMKATVHTHNEWFRLQMCKDRFEGLLRIDSLKEVSSSLLGDGASKQNIENSTHGSSQATISSSNKTLEDCNSPTQVSSRDLMCDEGAILKVMEFLALPRADAIHLLTQYNGNAEAVIQQIFP